MSRSHRNIFLIEPILIYYKIDLDQPISDSQWLICIKMRRHIDNEYQYVVIRKLLFFIKMPATNFILVGSWNLSDIYITKAWRSQCSRLRKNQHSNMQNIINQSIDWSINGSVDQLISQSIRILYLSRGKLLSYCCSL